MIATRTYFLAEDGSTVVGEGDPRAHTLLCRAGCHVDAAYLKARGLTLPDDATAPSPGPAATPADEEEGDDEPDDEGKPRRRARKPR